MLYGLFARWGFGHDLMDEIMSAAFIFGVPIALGFISVLAGTCDSKKEKESQEFKARDLTLAFILPWPAALAFLLGTLILLWEGLICIILWLPIVLTLSSFGGLLGGLARLYLQSRKTYFSSIGIVALAPFLISPIEQINERATDVKTVHTSIVIHASAASVWEQIRSIPKIQEAEHSTALIHTLGFPRPVAAELIGEGVGSIRNATFEGNVLFVERVTLWEPYERIGFTIEADTENIPPDTFDEHVTIGGPYFDVLYGEYWIEEIDEGSVRLHLHSSQRVSTGFNFYAHLWTTWLMDELQTYIIEIIKTRAEATPQTIQP